MTAIVAIIVIACVLATLVAVALVRSGSEHTDYEPLLGRSRQPWFEATALLVLVIVLSIARCP